MIPYNFPWKPVAKEAAVVVAREAGVYLFRLAIDHAIDLIHGEGTRPESREQPGSGRQPSGTEPQTEEEADPEGPGPKKPGAQRRKRDENGRYVRKTQNRKGGDNP